MGLGISACHILIHVGDFMTISAVPSSIPAYQPPQVQNAPKTVAQSPAPAAPAGGDSDGDADGSGVSLKA